MWLISTPSTGRRWNVGEVDASLGGEGGDTQIFSGDSLGLVCADLGLSLGLLVLEPDGLFLESDCAATVVRAVCLGDICGVSLAIMACEVGG